MPETKTHKQFVKELYQKSEAFRNGDYCLLGTYEKFHGHIRVGTEFGVCMAQPSNLLRGDVPTIKSAVNKTDHFRKQLAKTCPEYLTGSYDVIEYIKGLEIVVKDQYGFCKMATNNLFRGGTPNIRGAVDKQSYWVNKATEIHKGIYTYENVKYINGRSTVDITCPIHGSFKTRADHHTSGVSCRKCKPGNTLGIFSRENAINHMYEWSEIDSILYFLKITDHDEVFYKVGITTKPDVSHRITNFPSNFKIEVLLQVYRDLYTNVMSELTIKEDLEQFKYLPKRNFKGKTECFLANPLELYYLHQK